MNLTVKRSDVSYEIAIGKGLLAKAGKHFDLDRKVLVVTDDGIPRPYVQAILAQCKEPTLVTIPAGEESKILATYETILKVAIAADLTRSDAVLALGGGMVCDLAGFVAATYLRGIDFYSVPTTLLAMADASVGGKTGLNLEGYKNQVGAFYQPSGVLIDPELLATLDRRQLACGYAEILKMALTLDADLFYRMEDGFPRFVVLTRPPAREIEFIHDRMPLILPEDRINDWIDPSADPEAVISSALEEMIFEPAV